MTSSDRTETISRGGVPRKAGPPPAGRRRTRWRLQPLLLTLLGAVVAIAGSGMMTVRASTAVEQRDDAQETAVVIADRAGVLAQQVRAQCSESGGTRRYDATVCEQAQQVLTTPGVATTPEAQASSQVTDAVRQALAGIPPGIPPEQIIAEVQKRLAEQGQPVQLTPDAVRAIVLSLLDERPASLTPEQVQALVRAEISAMAATPGPAGAQGVGVTGFDVTGTGASCSLVLTFTNPANGESTQQARAINPAVCDGPPPAAAPGPEADDPSPSDDTTVSDSPATADTQPTG